MADKYYLDQEGLERLVQYINNALSAKANSADVPSKEDLDEYIANATGYIDQDELNAALADYVTGGDFEDFKATLNTVYHFRGSVANLTELQAIENPELGDVYNIVDTGMNAAWDGEQWDDFGSIADLTDYMLKEDVDRIAIPVVDQILYGGASAVVADVAGINAMLANDEPEVSITLADDIAEIVTVPAGKKVHLDLGGNEVRGLTVNGGEVIVSNGTIESSSTVSEDPVQVSDGGRFVLDGAEIVGHRNNGVTLSTGGQLVVNSGSISAQEAGVYPSGNSTVTINGGTISCVDNGGLMANGTAGRGGNTIVMNGGRIEGHITSAGYLACGVYLPNDDVFTMNGGEIISDGVGIVLRGGKAILNGGVVEGNGVSGVKGKVGDSRVVVGPYAVVYDSESKYPAKDSLELVVGADMILRGTDGDIDVVGENANITDNRG